MLTIRPKISLQKLQASCLTGSASEDLPYYITQLLEEFSKTYPSRLLGKHYQCGYFILAGMNGPILYADKKFKVDLGGGKYLEPLETGGLYSDFWEKHKGGAGEKLSDNKLDLITTGWFDTTSGGFTGVVGLTGLSPEAVKTYKDYTSGGFTGVVGLTGLSPEAVKTYKDYMSDKMKSELGLLGEKPPSPPTGKQKGSQETFTPIPKRRINWS